MEHLLLVLYSANLKASLIHLNYYRQPIILNVKYLYKNVKGSIFSIIVFENFLNEGNRNIKYKSHSEIDLNFLSGTCPDNSGVNSASLQ